MVLTPEEYRTYDALGLAQLIQQKHITPSELLEVAIHQVETYNPTFNAVIYKMYEEAQQCLAAGLPQGPFQGVPFY